MITKSITEEEGGAAAEEGGEEGGQEEGKKENLSDISEEEEIKIPPKDLTGKIYSSDKRNYFFK
jgi:hypothetical protein